MVYSTFNLGLFMLLMGLLSLIMNSTHLLNMLLSLELMSLSIFMVMNLFFYFKSDQFFLLFFFIIIVCEAVVGLSLLVTSSHSHNSDYLKEFNTLVC